jgi:DNA repair exonuclease SbcCD ATPase subunit
MRIQSVYIGTLIALSLGACQSNIQESPEYKSLQQRTDSLQSQVAAKDQEVEDVSTAINEIENNLAAIEKDQLSINEIKKEGQDVNQKERINTMIAGIDNYIEQNRQKMERLEQQVKKGGKRVSGLQKLVASLRVSIAKKEEEITQLRSTITGLETENTGLKDAVATRDRSLTQRDSALSARQQMIEERDNEIFTAYYIHGTKRDLAEAGIIDKTGGFLGLGKTAKLSGKVDKTKFTAINTRVVDDINLGITKKKNVISSHPSDTYYITKQGEEVHLKITDLKRFWSLTRYLVVETK